jgi:NAD(P)H dehydrogenase (quinone)
MHAAANPPILVTGVPGHVGGVGVAVVAGLRRRGLPVRALARREDARTDAMRASGVDVVIGDLTRPPDVKAALEGCRRLYFGLSVSPRYLEATATVAAVARAHGGIEALVGISQMTVSQMSVTATTDSGQQRQHWLGEQVLNWSGLPVVHVRPTVFLQHPFFSEWAAESIERDSTIRLPFGTARTSPVDAEDVASVIAAILAAPAAEIGAHIGRTYELTGPRSQDMNGVAAEYSAALGRPITYIDVPFDQWRDEEVGRRELPHHLCEHFMAMARLHAGNRYDRLTNDVAAITGRPATGIREYVARNRALFKRWSPPASGVRGGGVTGPRPAAP